MTVLLSGDREAEITATTPRKRPSPLSGLERDFFLAQIEREGKFWVSDADLWYSIHSSHADDESDRTPGRAAVLERLIVRWAEAAVSHAIVRSIDDPNGLVATVAGIDGAWGFGDSANEALQDLRSVLIDWASLKLKDGDDDIPSMEGLHLVVGR